jgi:integrase
VRKRELFTDADELVFPNAVGGFFSHDAMYRRYRAAQKKAGLRPLRFHDLRHGFGTMAVRIFPITDVQTWMGHADITTTRKYIHYAPQPEASARLGALVGERLAEISELPKAS